MTKGCNYFKALLLYWLWPPNSCYINNSPTSIFTVWLSNVCITFSYWLIRLYKIIIQLSHHPTTISNLLLFAICPVFFIQLIELVLSFSFTCDFHPALQRGRLFYALILSFSRTVAKAMLHKKAFIRPQKQKISVPNKNPRWVHWFYSNSKKDMPLLYLNKSPSPPSKTRFK